MKPVTLVAILLPAARAAVNGRCSGVWNDGSCICLDKNACTGTWNGFAYEGTPGNYPCPNDASNVWGCYITRNCKGKASGTACAWRNNPNGCWFGSFIEDAVCPGPYDFACCVPV